jgi:diaminopimelate decarboxylase
MWSNKRLLHVFAGVDSGFNHLIRPMLYGSQHQIENISLKERALLFCSGIYCETDTFANNKGFLK